MSKIGGRFLIGALLCGLMVDGAAAQIVTPHAPNPKAAKLKNPIQPSQASIANGQALYAQKCASCHGPDAKGAPNGVADEDPPASDLTAKKLVFGTTEGEIFTIIKGGIYPELFMPTFDGVLADKEIWDVVNYLATLRNE